MTAGYAAIFSALIVYLGGGMLGSYKGRAGTMLRDILLWLALGLGIAMLKGSTEREANARGPDRIGMVRAPVSASRLEAASMSQDEQIGRAS